MENPSGDTAVHRNTIYLLNLNLVKNELKLTLVDTLKLESVVEVARGGSKPVHCEYEKAANYVKNFGKIGDEKNPSVPDYLSSVMFLEAKTTNYLVCLNKESSKFHVFSVEKDALHQICLQANFADKFRQGDVKFI